MIGIERNINMAVKNLINLVLLVSVILLSVFSSFIYAKENNTSFKKTKYKDSLLKQSETKKSIYRNAKMWGITIEDWARYKEIMKGPQGIWTPNLDPLMALGLNAKTENERRRIALIQLKLEEKRLVRMLAYDRTYKKIEKEYFGNQTLVDIKKLKRRITLAKKARKIRAQDKQMQIGDRLLLFVSLKGCEQCRQTAYRAIDYVRGKKGVGVDIFFVGTTNKEKNEIQAWAKSMSISSLSIKHGNVSLNYDRGTFKRLTKDQGVLPLVIRKRGSKLTHEVL